MSVRTDHQAALIALHPDEWDAYLAAHSGLPGPRGNLELLAAAGDVAPAGSLRRWAASDDEYEASVGTAGLGRLVLEGDQSLLDRLRELAQDGRWRVREAVAMALQRIGDADLALAQRVALEWCQGPPLVQRAAMAALCEPRLLRAPGAATSALGALDVVTASLVAAPAATRRDDDVRVLRQALGYCWSVALAAAPDEGFDALDRWSRVPDVDVRWILRENLRKSRLLRADPGRADALARAIQAPPAAQATRSTSGSATG